MKRIITNEQTNQIPLIYEESFWTGKRKITYGDIECQKENKLTYSYNTGEEESKYIYIKGSQFTGISLNLDGNIITVLPKTAWWEYTLVGVLVFVSLFFVLGGALGGGLAALIGMTALLVNRYMKKTFLRVLIPIAMFAVYALIVFIVAFFVGFTVGLLVR